MKTLPLLSFLLLTSATQAATLEGRIVRVSDGDTVTLLDADKTPHKIRLQGIDAPEKKQPFGQRSKQHLSDLVAGKQVIADCGKIDRYRRQVCKILVNGQDANLAQVDAGMAWHYKTYAKEQPAGDRRSYSVAEDAARAGQIGLWRDPDPMAPWDWRKRLR